MSYSIVNIPQIANELLEVLVKNKVPVQALDEVLEAVKSVAYSNTVIQKKS